jgi:hypothetical protein
MYLALIFIYGGSSWGHGDTIEKAATNAVKAASRDWTHMFTFEEPVPVNIFDITDHEEWFADHRGVFGMNDGEEPVKLERLELIHKEVPKRRRAG